jgi:hypothetical protein
MNPVAAFGEVRGLGYVVPAERLRAHVEHWAHTMGVGPWRLVEHPPVHDVTHLGEPSTLDLTIAVAHASTLQVVLIAQHGEQPSTFLDFLERTRGEGGLHHLTFWPPDLDRAEEQAAEWGWELWTAGSVWPFGRFRHYLTEDHPGTVIELAEVPDRPLFEVELTEASRRFDPAAGPLYTAPDWGT